MKFYVRKNGTKVFYKHTGRPILPESKITDGTARWRATQARGPANKHRCHDCNKPAVEYDHPKGYKENWNTVDPVCRSCHRKREWQRGRSPLPRKWNSQKEYHHWYYLQHKKTIYSSQQSTAGEG
jgi:hypothetical protein